MADITIPDDLRPKDGRFGCGPSLVRDEALDALNSQRGRALMGTSHRQAGIKSLVGTIREGLADLFQLPEGYEVILGNGGATLFWDAATYGLIEKQSMHAVFGEFSSKFAKSAKIAPHLNNPIIVESEIGTLPALEANDDVDVYALTHNETSTGVTMPIRRVSENGLVLVDATSAAGAISVDPEEFDVYYFSGQKAFGAEGGVFYALLSPDAVERIKHLSEKRSTPPILDLSIALDNSLKNQTYNTPAISTLFLMAENVTWLAECGLDKVASEAKDRAEVVYEWAEARSFASPFVADELERSPVVATIDIEENINADEICAALRANGILDTDPYRKLGRNQLRIGLWPATSMEDVQKLIASIDYVIEHM